MFYMGYFRHEWSFSYNLFGISIATMLLFGPPLTLALSREELIQQQCGDLPTSKRHLIVTKERQRKEYRFAPLEKVGHVTSGGSTVSGSACDVWDFKALMEKWVVVVLTDFHLEKNDALFVIRELKTGVSVDRFGLDLHTTGLSSRGPLTLVWIRRNLMPFDTGNGASYEFVPERKLSFFYFTDDDSQDDSGNDELVLVAAIVISAITLAATVLSLVRAASCHRTFLPCWLIRRRQAMASTTSEGDYVTTEATTRRLTDNSGTFLLMEMEVARSVTSANDGNNSHNNSGEFGDGENNRMLPPSYDQVMGRLPAASSLRRSRRNRSRNEPSSIPEEDEEMDENDDDETAVANISSYRNIEPQDPRQRYDVTQSSSHIDTRPITSWETTRELPTHSESHSVNGVDFASTQNINNINNIEDHIALDDFNEHDSSMSCTFSTATTGLTTRTITNVTFSLASSSPTLSDSLSPPTPPSTSALGSVAILMPTSRMPRFQLLPRLQGSNSGLNDTPLYINPFNASSSTLQENTDEAPPPSYYDESPPPSYDSLFRGYNLSVNSDNTTETTF